jgi:hypothetical protein
VPEKSPLTTRHMRPTASDGAGTLPFRCSAHPRVELDLTDVSASGRSRDLIGPYVVRTSLSTLGFTDCSAPQTRRARPCKSRENSLSDPCNLGLRDVYARCGLLGRRKLETASDDIGGGDEARDQGVPRRLPLRRLPAREGGGECAVSAQAPPYESAAGPHLRAGAAVFGGESCVLSRVGLRSSRDEHRLLPHAQPLVVAELGRVHG